MRYINPRFTYLLTYLLVLVASVLILVLVLESTVLEIETSLRGSVSVELYYSIES